MPDEDIIDPEDREAADLALHTRADATNRGIRTAIQFALVGLIVDGISVANELLDALDAGEDVNWSEPVRALIRIMLGALLAVVMRYQAPPPAPQD